MFSDDGTLARLGLNAIHNKSGIGALAHNKATEKDIEPLVIVRFKCGSVMSEGSRKASGTARTRPAIADAVQACFTVSPLIHGHELRSFVEDETSQDRYQYVARWLQLGRLVEVQMDLRELRRRTKAAAEDQTAIRFVDTQLTTRSAGVVNVWDEAAVLEYANTLLVVLDKTFSLKSLDRADPVFMTTQYTV